MAELIQRVEQTIARRRLLNKGAAALLAVSGGVDSMVLLRVLHELSSRHNWKLTVAHFNHLLRGRESDADERFVARTAKKLGLHFVSKKGDVQAFARERKLSLEMAGRTMRHDFLARSARTLGIPNVALAHHADDQVELFFVRLLRGAGTQGLGGMEWSAPSPADGNIALVRPLLGESKSALLAFAHAKRISFREDATNLSHDILRNRIRRELLPLLRRKYQTGIDGAVLRSMELLRDEGEFVTVEAIRWLESRRHEKTFDELAVALQRRITQIGLLGAGIVPQFNAVEFLRRHPDEWHSVENGQICRRTAHGKVEFRPVTPSFRPGELKLDLHREKELAQFGEAEVNWKHLAGRKLPARRISNTEFFDAQAVGSPIILRHWRAGDRFQPIGAPKPSKLQDLFVNQKIPRARRYELVLATTLEGEIFWVEGLRIGERFKVTSATQRRLKWRWRRL